MQIVLPDEEATGRLAARLAALLAPGDVVVLWGDLGSGKTALVRALIRDALEEPEAEVPSPTFTLVQTYDLPMGTLWHFDLYRVAASEEAIELGWEEARAGGIAMIEWPDRLGDLLPADRLDLRLAFADAPGARLVHLDPVGAWSHRPIEALADRAVPP